MEFSVSFDIENQEMFTTTATATTATTQQQQQQPLFESTYS